jgi:hypothetical protein
LGGRKFAQLRHPAQRRNTPVPSPKKRPAFLRPAKGAGDARSTG